MSGDALANVQRSACRWLAAHESGCLVGLLTAAVVLRALLVTFSPTPFGYVWDFYHLGVRVLYDTGHLPVAADCWQCYHPPLFYVTGWPLYAFGRRITPGPDVAMGWRFLAGLALVSSAITIYYGYRLLRLFRCRGASLVLGFALLVTFPCLFISSYGAEADIVLTAILSAFIYYLVRDYARSPDAGLWAATRMGLLTGLAAATKYSGLVGIASVLAVLGIRVLAGPRRAFAVRDGAVIVIICLLTGGWKYIDNVKRYGTPLFANGTAAEGFTFARRATFVDQYEFTTLRLGDLMTAVGPRAPRGPLTDLPVYRSVLTTLHALAWSDLGFFSDPSRHGDPSRPYPPKRVPPNVTRAVLLLGFVPEALAIAGFVVTIRRRIFLPINIVCAVALAAYVWWFVSQPAWGLKTKYLLFLLPPFALYAVIGLAWLWRRAPALLSLFAASLVVILVLLTHVYLFAFSVG
jgi:4-amino-4-deoxy-L-arabinose transferase-like glycosyltransferase